MTASHLVASRFGKATLTAIFGKDVEDELFSAKNGLMLNYILEEYFESGFFAIVSDLAESATPLDRKAWRNSEVKEYKIRFIDKPISEWVPGLKPNSSHLHLYNTALMGDLRWSDLDGRKLEFRNNKRPRARILEPEVAQFYWGTPKRYVKGTMLPGFLKEIRHRYEQIFDDPEGEEDAPSREYGEGSSDLLREAATSQVALGAGDKDDELSSDEDADEEGIDWLN